MKNINHVWTRRIPFAIVACFGFTFAADGLFYRQPWGWAAGAYAGGLIILFSVRYQRLWRTDPVLMIANLGLVVALVNHPGPLVVLLALLGLMAVGLTARLGFSPFATQWIRRWARFPFTASVSLLRDGWSLQKYSRPIQIQPTKFLRLWAWPVAWSLVFVCLLLLANPILSGWAQKLNVSLDEFWRYIDNNLSLSRTFFWLAIGSGLWALLRARFRTKPRSIAPPLIGYSESWMNPESLTRALLLFNGLFVLQNSLDLIYLWSPLPLPAGLTYATYAHRGAYPLIATAILAAVFVMFTFRAGGQSEQLTWPRRLVLIWVIQNVILTISAAWRLKIYVEAYGLTRLRFSAAVWMVLVALGLVFIGHRVWKRRSNDWLWNVNALSALGVIYFFCFFPVDGTIALYNVRHCREIGATGPSVDIAYLERLGEDALPALQWYYEHTGDGATGAVAATMVGRQRDALFRRLKYPLAWTWRRHRLLKGTNPAPHLSGGDSKCGQGAGPRVEQPERNFNQPATCP